jgi:hypothetical protein
MVKLLNLTKKSSKCLPGKTPMFNILNLRVLKVIVSIKIAKENIYAISRKNPRK